MNYQIAPFPETLAELVGGLKYKEGYTFSMDRIERDPGCHGLTLIVHLAHINSYPPHKPRRTVFYFQVPGATYNRSSWTRWLFERIAEIERHEQMEWFTIDGEKPYAPNHGPGEDPYIVREVTTDEQRRTSFRGELNPE